MAKIDYLTVSLSSHKDRHIFYTNDILDDFASLLPDLYKKTCRDRVCNTGKTERVSQYGITVSKQYGSALDYNWRYTCQLSGDFWHALDRDTGAVLKLLSNYSIWRISRADFASDVCVPIADWQSYYKAAFDAGYYTLNGRLDSRTVYYGSRKSQIYARVYNKTANDPKHHPAPEGFVQVRAEIEIHRVRGELVLTHVFDKAFTDRLFLQRARCIAKMDASGFIRKYFVTAGTGKKIKIVKRTVGDLESTIDYVFDAYGPYIAAVMNSQHYRYKYKTLDEKGQKILAVLDRDIEVIRHD